MDNLAPELLLAALDLIEAITYGKIKDNIIYDLYGNKVFRIKSNSPQRRELELITDIDYPQLDNYKRVYSEIIGQRIL